MIDENLIMLESERDELKQRVRDLTAECANLREQLGQAMAERGQPRHALEWCYRLTIRMDTDCEVCGWVNDAAHQALNNNKEREAE